MDVRQRVRLGEWNTETDVDCDNVRGYRDCNERPVDLEIEETIVHPDYKVNSANRHNDIALLRLNRDVGFTGKYIGAHCISVIMIFVRLKLSKGD